MDELVKAALLKWPQVPHCHGWLALDARGDWYMRDERIQAQGIFPAIKGSRIQHEKLLAFIGRNYGADPEGCWFFQNGPQRVYVELECSPWVWRLTQPEAGGGSPLIRSHTGLMADLRELWLDELGRVYLLTDLGLGLVHSLDTAQAADALDAGTWAIAGECPAADLPTRFGFVRAPQA